MSIVARFGLKAAVRPLDVYSPLRWAQMLLIALVALILTDLHTPSLHAALSLTNIVREDFWDTDGTVNAVVASNGVVYVGGSFSYVGPRTKKITAVNAYTSEPIGGFPAITGGTVGCIIPDENGGWYLGGDFIAVGGVPRTNLVHLHSDFAVDPLFAPNPDGVVRTLVLDNSILFVGGDFVQIAGQSRSRLAALQASDGAALPWNPDADGEVLALQVFEDTVYVGGRFTMVAGQARNHLAALRKIDGTPLPWSPQINGDVLTIGVNDDRIFVGGNYSVVDGALRSGLAAFDRLALQLVSSWDPNARDGLIAGSVTTLRAVCNVVYVGGRFTRIGDAPRIRVAALDAASGRANAWDTRLLALRQNGLPSTIQTIEVSGNTIFIAGAFVTGSGPPRFNLVAADSTTGTLTTWNPGLDGEMVTLGVAGRTLLVSMDTGSGGKLYRNLAAFDEATGRALSWGGSGPDYTVTSLALDGSTLYVGGSFSNLNGFPRSRLAAVDAASGLVMSSWLANANADVQALLAADGRLFVGGRFTTVAGITRRGLAVLDSGTGQLIAGWSPHADGGDVRALAKAGDTLYVGGSFTQLAFVGRDRLAAVHSISGALLPWNPGCDAPVQALLASVGVVYAGGQFRNIAGQPASGVAALSASSGQVVPWISGVPSLDPDVRTMTINGSAIYLGGGILELAGQRRLGLAAVHTNGTVLPWNPGASPFTAINALAISEKAAYAGGAKGMAFADAASKRSLACFPQTGAPGWLLQPLDSISSPGGTVIFSALAASDLPITYRWRLNGNELPGEVGSTLVNTNTQTNQEGTYEIIASNALGAIAAQASLRVFVPVQIISQPSPVFTTSGSNVTLTVVASGNPAPIFQWRLNGVFIPGAVQPTLTLGNSSSRNGGSYSVAVANPMGTLLSQSVPVNILTNGAPFSDAFAGRGTIFGASGSVRGDNIGATFEEGFNEPRHAGKRGGASVWLKWIAPVTGLATFTTRGSSFDTLLGIYSNANLATLVEMASDEDRGGFLTSRASLNVQAGGEYQIAVDGLGGAVGNIVLSWETETNTFAPTITAPPLSQTRAVGETAAFFASVSSSSPIQYQWFFGCQSLRGATNAALIVTNVQPRNAGLYYVVVANQAGIVSASLPAVLEIGALSEGRSFPKLEDLILALSGTAGGGAFQAASPGGVPLFLLSLGSPLSHTFSTSTNSPSLLISECDVITGGAAFLSFSPNQNGVILIDTLGSIFDTVLSVFNYVDPLHLASNLIACDNDSAPDRIRSVIRLPAVAGHQYLVRVSGVGGAIGRAQVNWNLGLPPGIVSSNATMIALEGGTLSVDAGVVTGGLPTFYYWFRNGERIAGSTNANLELTGVTASMGGVYSVIVSNFAGVVTNTRASIEVRRPLRLSQIHWAAGGKFSFAATGNPNDLFVIETCSSLANAGNPAAWTVVLSARIPASGEPVYFTDSDPPTLTARFYRIRPPP